MDAQDMGSGKPGRISGSVHHTPGKAEGQAKAVGLVRLILPVHAISLTVVADAHCVRAANRLGVDMTCAVKAFFVWMRRLVAAPFPLTLSLSRKGRGNPRTISSYKCKPL